MQKWIGHVAMMSNIISNLIFFEIFDSEHEYLRFCVYRVLWFTDFKLEIARHPRSTSLSIGNLLSTTKRTVEIISIKYPSSTTPLVVVSRTTDIYYSWVVVSRIQFISDLKLQIVCPSGCRKSIHTKGNDVRKQNCFGKDSSFKMQCIAKQNSLDSHNVFSYSTYPLLHKG